MKRLALVATLMAALAAPVPAQIGEKNDAPTPERLGAIADRAAPSIVLVEYVPQYDKGESPGSGRWRAWAAYPGGSSQAAGSPDDWEDWSELIRDERPGVKVGFLIAPDAVYTADPMIHPRFIKSISVRFNDRSTPARVAAFPVDGGGYILRLNAPLPGAVPLKFEPQRAGPYFGVSADRRDGAWTTRVSPLRSDASVAEDGRRYVPGTPHILVVDEQGNPVTIAARGARPIDGSWKRPPDQWRTVSAADMDAALARLEKTAAGSVVRVLLEFRSPRTSGGEGGMGYERYRGGPEEPVATEWNGVGVLVNDTTLLVLAPLKPKVTARLEKITAFLPDGRGAKAAFAGSLREWGGLLATLDAPAAGAVTLDASPAASLREQLLLKAEVAVRGETRTAYFSRDRIDSFYPGFRGRLFPEVSPSRDEASGPYDTGGGSMNFLFTREGTLAALPIKRREKVTVAERWDSGQLLMTPPALLAEILREPGAHFDPDNVPLSEEEENRLAWLGVELQAMDAELARANSVVDQTNGGESGGIVSYVYPGSPAAEAGLQMGDIVLRLHIEGHPRPLEVQLEPSWGGGMLDQFWSMLDQVPDEYFDRMPAPWGSAENTLNTALTEVGFGTPFTAEVFRDGAIVTAAFKVTQGPPHYEAAQRFKSEAAGVTVRDLTYEARRYFQLGEKDPGVIVSKIERGGKAAVGGLKPFEIVTAVNDQPVTSATEFEKAIAPGGELKLDVKRMTKGRVVKIKVDAAGK
ncbi:MAG: PDZ domain-containing protein [Phycisphaerales bacterium]